MQVAMASSPGHEGRSNEDFVGAIPGAIVLLDGAGIPDTGSVCRHGVAWYTQTLGGLLLARLSGNPGIELVRVLADSIDEVARTHRECDLADPSSPQAAVAMLRVAGAVVDHLVLADAYVVLDDRGPTVVTDPREVDVRAEVLAAHDERSAAVDAFRARRNVPGGYWIAKDDPAAAHEAVTGSVPLAALSGAAVLSNGVRRLVDPYAVTNWPGLLDVLRADGPDALLGWVRASEPRGGLAADDATVAYCSFGPTAP